VRHLAAGRVEIPADDARLRIAFANHFLDALRARAEVANACGLAHGAARRHGRLLPAVVADEVPCRRVIGVRDRAPRALDHIAAIPAHDEGGCAAPVQEEDCLLAKGERLHKRLVQALGQDGCVPLVQFRAHVDDPHGRQFSVQRITHIPLGRAEASLRGPDACGLLLYHTAMPHHPAGHQQAHVLAPLGAVGRLE